MRSSEVIITLDDRHLGKRRYVYAEPWICLVGRAQDCDIRVPTDLEHLQVSRHHCLLEIEPPMVRIRDLGSTNGTFINGSKMRATGSRSEADWEQPDAFVTEVKDGDAVQLGGVSLQLRVEVRTEELLPA